MQLFKKVMSVLTLLLLLSSVNISKLQASSPAPIFIANPHCIETHAGIITKAIFNTSSLTISNFSSSPVFLTLEQAGNTMATSVAANWSDPDYPNQIVFDLTSFNIQYSEKCYDWGIYHSSNTGYLATSFAPNVPAFCALECELDCNYILSVHTGDMGNGTFYISPTTPLPPNAIYTIYDEQSNVVYQNTYMSSVIVQPGCYTVEIKLNNCVKTVCVCTFCNQGNTKPTNPISDEWDGVVGTSGVNIRPLVTNKKPIIKNIKVLDRHNQTIFRDGNLSVGTYNISTAGWGHGVYYVIVNRTDIVQIVK